MNLTQLNKYNIHGYTVLTDPNMVESIPKTWKERLTWKFWITSKIVPLTDFVIIAKYKTLICHPSQEQHLKHLKHG